MSGLRRLVVVAVTAALAVTTTAATPRAATAGPATPRAATAGPATPRAATAGPATPHAATAVPAVAVAPAPGNPKVPGGSDCCGPAALRPGDSVTSEPDTGSLEGGALGAGPSNQIVTHSGYRLSLQSDGNMVEYQDVSVGRRAVWSTGTVGAAAPTTLRFQSDGNVVLRDRTGRAVWSTGTAGRPTAYFSVYGNGQLVTQDSTGHVLSAHGPAEVALPGFAVERAYAPGFVGGGYRYLRLQGDDNLVEYVYAEGGAARAVWSTRTAGAGQVRLTAQSDGNLVLRQVSTGRAVWASGTPGPTAYHQLDLQDDGNLVLYRTDGIRRVQAVWSTGVRR